MTKRVKIDWAWVSLLLFCACMIALLVYSVVSDETMQNTSPYTRPAYPYHYYWWIW